MLQGLVQGKALGLTETPEGFDPSGRGLALLAAELAPVANLHVVVRLHDVVHVLVRVHLQGKDQRLILTYLALIE